MLRGLRTLVWIEIKIFVREPLGVFATVGMPVLVFMIVGRMVGDRPSPPADVADFTRVGLPVFASMLIAIGAVLSLVAVISIYREGGILKRLRATPLRAQTILLAQVVVKLVFTVLTLALLVLAGRRGYPLPLDAPILSYTLALLFSTFSVLSIGFLIASVVPSARFAQPLGSLVLYPMIAVSGLFTPIDMLPPALAAVARVLPLTYAVSLLDGIWRGHPWSAHLFDVGALGLTFVAATALSARLFRWE